MAIALPPSIHADYLVLRRAGWMAMARTAVAPALLVLGCAVLACAALYRGFTWCIPVTAMFALAGSFALVRNRLQRILERSRFGWCGALPVRPWATTWVLLVSVAAALAVAVGAGNSLLGIAATAAPHRNVLALAILAVDGGLAVGSAAAVVTVFRKGAAARSRHVEGIREPLFALPWLNDRHLPHLLDWQRRSALVQWRRGGSALVAVVLVAVPDSASIPRVVGLVLLALSLAWLAVVMRACAEVTTGAVWLLGAMPADANRMRWASLRYPLVALVCAAILAVAGVLLVDGGWVPAIVWAACGIAFLPWAVARILKSTAAGRS